MTSEMSGSQTSDSTNPLRASHMLRDTELTARTRALAERKDAEEEFFKMLLLAYKMNYVKAFPTVMKVS